MAARRRHRRHPTDTNGALHQSPPRGNDDDQPHSAPRSEAHDVIPNGAANGPAYDSATNAMTLAAIVAAATSPRRADRPPRRRRPPTRPRSAPIDPLPSRQRPPLG